MNLKSKIVLLAYVSPAISWATPQLLPADQMLLNELRGLVNRNVIELNLSSWPLSLSEVNFSLENATINTQSDKLVVQRLKDNLKEKRDGFTVGLVSHTTMPRLSLGIPDSYDQHRLYVSQSARLHNIDFYLSANYLQGRSVYRDKKVDLSGSYVALKLFNQWISIGQQQHYWGQGHTGSLIFGASARPMLGVHIQRDRQDAFKSKWLSWLGTWQYQVFAGQTLNHKGMRSPENSKLIGMHLSINPTNYLEFGASRAIQWGGKGRPQNFSSLRYALLGKDNAGQNVDRNNEPGNQIAGADFRIRLYPLVNLPISIYGQVAGEDESKYLPTQNFYLLGIDGSHNISHRQTLNWYLEGVDTSIDFGRRFNAYSHHLYPDGYYQQKMPLGYALGRNMRVISLGLNSSYHSNDISSIIQEHHWQAKLTSAKAVQPKKSLAKPVIHRGIELSWMGEIPINRYIEWKVGGTAWLTNTKNDKSRFGIGLNTNLSF